MSTKQQIKNGRQLAAAEKLHAGVPLSLMDWCALEDKSRESWYQAARRGTAPAFYYSGGVVRIDPTDYRAWQEARKADAERRREAAAAERSSEAA